ncbi:uncharacterized protein [Rutidosis leptorrhynchoides]|uniref:uncharacterized protein n=1 Tax=Rutidosis leptorrhynchoides TaxID=125765 RepID=UPI003A992A33
MADDRYLHDRAVLALTNDIVVDVNKYILSNIPGETKTHLSLDGPCTSEGMVERHDDIITSEFLNTITSSGLPRHELKLKVGVLVMLLRNIDQSARLCNGTRLMVTRSGDHVIEGNIMTRSHAEERVFISRLTLQPSDKMLPFHFQRRQFLLALSFAMTINKSQGQSLWHVGGVSVESDVLLWTALLMGKCPNFGSHRCKENLHVYMNLWAASVTTPVWKLVKNAAFSLGFGAEIDSFCGLPS